MYQTVVGTVAISFGLCAIVFWRKGAEHGKRHYERLNRQFGTPLPPDGLFLGMTIAFGGLSMAIGIAVLLKALFE